MKAWVVWALFVIAFIYNILDAYQTKLLLSVGAKEANPIMEYFIVEYGINSLYSVKIIMFLCLGGLLWQHQQQFKRGE